MEQFEKYIEKIWIIVVAILVEFFMCRYIMNFKQLDEIKKIRFEKAGVIIEALKIAQVDGYWQHFSVGFAWAIILMFLIVFRFKVQRYIAVIIYISMLIFFWIVFWDPIVTTFLILAIVIFLFVCSMGN